MRMSETGAPKLDVVVRNNDGAKPGGDSLQIQRYIECWGRSVDAKILPYKPNLKFRDGSVVLAVNAQRPFDFLDIFRQTHGRPVIAAPIFHSLHRFQEMRAAERGVGLSSIIGRVLPEWAREICASVVRNLQHCDSIREVIAISLAFARSLAIGPRIWTRVGGVLDHARAVVLLAPGEGSDLQADTGWSGWNQIMAPNGAPQLVDSLRPWEDRDIPILVAGRIEPRKRSLEVAMAAAHMGVSVTFVGSLSKSKSRFSRKFVGVVERNDCITWVGPMEQNRVLDLMCRSRVLLNASWVEVQSLVDIEAAQAGCWVVSFNNGNSKDYMGQSLKLIIGNEVESLLNAASVAARGGTSPPKFTYEPTWDKSSATILKEISGCNGQHHH